MLTRRSAAQGVQNMGLGLGEPQRAIRSHKYRHWVDPTGMCSQKSAVLDRVYTEHNSKRKSTVKARTGANSSVPAVCGRFLQAEACNTKMKRLS